jgi:transposase
LAVEEAITGMPQRTLGLDVGDRWCHYCLLDKEGQVIDEGRIATQTRAIISFFARLAPARVALEVGPRSPWISRLVAVAGHEVHVANARKLKLIYQDGRKCDRLDAERLARLARLDLSLLCPIEHVSPQVQAHRALLRSRDLLVRNRAQLVLHVRGTVKAMGEALPKGITTEGFARRVEPLLPEPLRLALAPVIEQIALLTKTIRQMDRDVERLGREVYPQAALLTQVHGVGPLTALAFVLTIDDPARFRKSRRVGAFLGLVPGRSQSGEHDPPRRITRQGDDLLRRLLVQCGHYILGPFAIDSDLRRFGLAIAERGGTAARRRAVTAVARKLAVLLHRLLVTAEVYEPLRKERLAQPLAATA